MEIIIGGKNLRDNTLSLHQRHQFFKYHITTNNLFHILKAIKIYICINFNKKNLSSTTLERFFTNN